MAWRIAAAVVGCTATQPLSGQFESGNARATLDAGKAIWSFDLNRKEFFGREQ